MKKTMLCAFFMVTAGAVGNTQASDGTIHFTGSITDQTCSVDSGSKNLPVELGNVAQTALSGGAGTKAAPTRFTLSVSDCPDTVTSANVKFDGVNASNASLLALDDDAGAATGVGIEIADENGMPIPLQTASPDYPLAPGANTLDFVARYVSTSDTVTTGPANGTSEFTIIYK
ncbi:fimbrial protein [Enterobacter hormaechei]|nr:fimbrial protein [Enterobacter hormaechei]ELC7205483.1 fimbrial protein [Enterobacter hormaechei]